MRNRKQETRIRLVKYPCSDHESSNDVSSLRVVKGECRKEASVQCKDLYVTGTIDN